MHTLRTFLSGKLAIYRMCFEYIEEDIQKIRPVAHPVRTSWASPFVDVFPNLTILRSEHQWAFRSLPIV